MPFCWMYAKSEFDSEHVEGAEKCTLDYINMKGCKKKIPAKPTIHVQCLSGYRSMTFVSILKARVMKNLSM